MKTSIVFCVLLFTTLVARAQETVLNETLFHHNDPLAQYDEWGKLHQSKDIDITDQAPRYRYRWIYYFQHPDVLVAKPAYVGALQIALQRNGYYCGPIDGIYGPDVTEAIARLQKNYSMRVTGTLTDPVRRALHLP
jgi:hypothetical protein